MSSPPNYTAWYKQMGIVIVLVGLCAFLYDRFGPPLTTTNFIRPTVPMVIHALNSPDYIPVSGDYETGTFDGAQRRNQHDRGSWITFPPSLRNQIEQLVDTWCGDLLAIPYPKDPAYHVAFLCPDSQWSFHEIYFAADQVPPAILEVERRTPLIQP